MIDSNKINEVVSRIVSGFNPERIILFGSFASGSYNNNSDLDLLIIQESDLPMHKRGKYIRLSLIGSRIPIDILVYTSSEFNLGKDKKYSFLYSALKNAKVVYERAI